MKQSTTIDKSTHNVVIGMGDLHVSWKPDEILVAYALGPCVGLAIHDPHLNIGGLAHIQFPGQGDLASIDPSARWRSADCAIPELFARAFALGAQRGRIRVVIAGGAAIFDSNGLFQIGRKNLIAVKRILWQQGFLISSEAVGGTEWRTVRLNIATGSIDIQTSTGRKDL